MQLRVPALLAATVASCHTLLVWWHRRAAGPELIHWAWFTRGSMACTASVVACGSCHGSPGRSPLHQLPASKCRYCYAAHLRVLRTTGRRAKPYMQARFVHALVACCCHVLMPACVWPGPLCFARAPNPDAVEAKALHTRQLGDDLSSGPCLLGFYGPCKLATRALRTQPTRCHRLTVVRAEV